MGVDIYVYISGGRILGAEIEKINDFDRNDPNAWLDKVLSLGSLYTKRGDKNPPKKKLFIPL